VTDKKCKTGRSFVDGWFNHLRNYANLHNVNVSGVAASADIVATEEFLNLFGEIIEECGYLLEHVFNVGQ
jgi:hypothetical protein